MNINLDFDMTNRKYQVLRDADTCSCSVTVKEENHKQGDVMQQRKIKIQGVEHFRDVKRVLLALGYTFPIPPVTEDKIVAVYAHSYDSVFCDAGAQAEGFFDEHEYPEYRLVVEQVADDELHYRLSRVARKMNWEWEVRQGFLCIVDKHISSPVDRIIAHVYNLEGQFAIQGVREDLKRLGYTLSGLQFDKNGAVIFTMGE